MRNSEEIWHLVDAKKDDFVALADRVWGMPELAYTEFKSSNEHVQALQKEGFRVTRDVAGIPTAITGEAGEDGPVIAILGEYDALPGLSQEAGVAEHRPIAGNGYGHGCGHNLLGSAALLAATAVKDFIQVHGIKGRVRYYGCPAEEGGAAKGFMVRDGAFDDVAIAISWHPASFSQVHEAKSLANTRIDFHFSGRAAHAAAAPHLGRSALDAVELMSVGVNYMREHMPSDARVHYAFLDAGGIAPNVVQSSATVRYLIRGRDLVDLNQLIARVRKIAEGAALMTETKVTAKVVSAVSNLIGNTPLEHAMDDAFQRLGPPPFDDADRAFAAKIQSTLSEADIDAAFRRFGLPVTNGLSLCDRVLPVDLKGEPMVGSTDVGDVSWAVPTVQAHGATFAVGTPLHSWQLTSQGKMPAAHKGMVHVAKVMAATAIAALVDETLIPRAKADHQARLKDTPYVSPLPKEIEPPLEMSKIA
ncbi:MAG: M20 family metallopeptidase [Pseudolabrys sp.]